MIGDKVLGYPRVFSGAGPLRPVHRKVLIGAFVESGMVSVEFAVGLARIIEDASHRGMTIRTVLMKGNDPQDAIAQLLGMAREHDFNDLVVLEEDAEWTVADFLNLITENTQHPGMHRFNESEFAQ